LVNGKENNLIGKSQIGDDIPVKITDEADEKEIFGKDLNNARNSRHS